MDDFAIVFKPNVFKLEYTVFISKLENRKILQGFHHQSSMDTHRHWLLHQLFVKHFSVHVNIHICDISLFVRWIMQNHKA